MKIKNKYKLVIVEWEDAAMGYQEWKSLQNQENKTKRILSIGFLTHKNKKCITICPHIENEKGDKNVCGEMIIPKKAILKIYEIPNYK